VKKKKKKIETTAACNTHLQYERQKRRRKEML
jgi:hypothetical protein